MLKLLIDHQTFTMQNYGGISRYFANIHSNIGRRKDMQSKIGILYTTNYYLKGYPVPIPNAIGRLWLKKQRRYLKWNKSYAQYLINKNHHTVFHPSYYDPYFLKHNKKPYVITVHDMIHERFPEYFNPDDPYVKFKRICVDNADHIIAISDTTKKDLKDILGVADNRITVIHHGYQMNSIFKTQDDLNDKAEIKNEYLLFVGDRKGYKNFPLFLTAISSLLHSDKTLRLICAGGGAFKSAELELIMRLGIQPQIIQINATDLELEDLYQKAKAFIFPSLYEGFGLPILEAFKNNCPVIASDNACFREIGENAIIYFDPHDLHSIAETIKEIITDNDIIQRLINDGNTRLKKFSMELCMEKTMDIYKNVSNIS